MVEVVIYSRAYCGYCQRAKSLLTAKGVAYHDIDLDAEPARRPEMIERAGGRTTVPQIFIDGRHIGGCDELQDLDRQGALAPLLGLAA